MMKKWKTLVWNNPRIQESLADLLTRKVYLNQTFNNLFWIDKKSKTDMAVVNEKKINGMTKLKTSSFPLEEFTEKTLKPKVQKTFNYWDKFLDNNETLNQKQKETKKNHYIKSLYEYPSFKEETRNFKYENNLNIKDFSRLMVEISKSEEKTKFRLKPKWENKKKFFNRLYSKKFKGINLRRFCLLTIKNRKLIKSRIKQNRKNLVKIYPYLVQKRFRGILKNRKIKIYKVSWIRIKKVKKIVRSRQKYGGTAARSLYKSNPDQKKIEFDFKGWPDLTKPFSDYMNQRILINQNENERNKIINKTPARCVVFCLENTRKLSARWSRDPSGVSRPFWIARWKAAMHQSASEAGAPELFHYGKQVKAVKKAIKTKIRMFKSRILLKKRTIKTKMKMFKYRVLLKRKKKSQKLQKKRQKKITRLIKMVKKENGIRNWDQEFRNSPLRKRSEYLVRIKKRKKIKFINYVKNQIKKKIKAKRKKLSLKSYVLKKKINKEIVFINDIGTPRHFPSATQEWSNSIYSYNRNEMRSVRGLDISVNKLIKSYFTSVPRSFISKNRLMIKKKRLTRKNWKLKTNKVYLSKSELKHTSSKVTITLFIYAERHINLTYLYKSLNKENLTLSMVKDNGLRDLKDLIDNYPNIAKNPKFIEKNRNNFLKYLNLEKKSINQKNFLEKKISKCYKKKVVFKIIRLKYLYLNNNMLADYITLKLIRKKRNLFKAKRKIWRKIKFPYIKRYGVNQTRLAKKRIILKSYRNESHGIRGKHIWDEWKKNKYFRPEIMKKQFRINQTYQDFLDFISYKYPFGIRLEIAGRLTRRNVAARSIKKYTYRGSLKNIDSTYRNLSVTNLRSCHKPNVEYTKVHSLTRTGAFTVRSWLSKY